MNWESIPWRLRYDYGARLASDARRAVILATHRHAHVELPKPVRLGPGFDLIIPGPGTFKVGPGSDFRRGFVAEISGDGRIEIGVNVTFTSYALIQCTTSVTIGDRAVFGQNLMIADGNHRYRDPDVHLLEQGYDYRPITIGAGAIVTSKCTILADIGERALVAANSVVTKPIPAFCVAAGSPARVIEYFGPPDLRPAELVD